MKVVWSWLLELCDLEREVDAAEGAAILTGLGLEVEEVEELGKGFSGVVVAEVVEKSRHPNADKLTLVKVSDGSGVTEVVCGAPNVPEPGGKVLWARPGAELPGGFSIGKRKLKGVESAGMLCSEKELGISDDHEGIAVLSGDEAESAAGATAQDALGLRDTVFDVGIPANRPDALGHIGVARELVAAVGGKVRPPAVDLSKFEGKGGDPYSVSIADGDACRRYTARVIDGMTVAPSPGWMRRRLAAVGVRPISNLVDITNYVMFELGHPLHAFDADKLNSKQIVVRWAKKDERMNTLDEVERTLTDGDLLICDGDRPVALAGVMGGLETEVSDGTGRVLLEAATFQPQAIRRTSRRLGLASESSYRFERHVDAEGVAHASARAARLMAELGGGRVVGDMAEAYPTRPERKSVTLRVSRIKALTGVEVSADVASAVLGRLGVDVTSSSAEALEVACPTFRPDLAREVDLIEEVLRHYGYDKVPATLPNKTYAPKHSRDTRETRVRDALVGHGLCEAITFGFCSRERIERLGFDSADERLEMLAVANPMSSDQGVMRTTLLGNLLSALAQNLKHDVSDVRLFEIGSVFLPATDARPGASPGLPSEPRRVSGVLCGRQPGWLVPGEAIEFADARGAVDAALVGLLGERAASVEYRPAADIPYLHPGVAARLYLDGRLLGEVGEVHPKIRQAFEIERVAFAFDLDLEAFEPSGAAVMSTIPRYPAIVRDVSFFVDEGVWASRVEGEVANCEEPLLVAVRCLEDYRDPERVPAGKKGMLWSMTYRSLERTLTDAEVDKAHEAIVDSLLAALGAERR